MCYSCVPSCQLHHRLVLFLNPGWKAMKVECCLLGSWKNLPLLEYEKISNPVWEYHDSSNFYRKFFAWWIKWYLFGWIEVQQRWTSAKVSVACRAHFQYRLRSYHVCTRLSGSNCSAATDLKCCHKNTPKLHKWLICQRKRLKHLAMSISPLIFSIQLTQ